MSRINALQFIRLIAFLCIFFSHAMSEYAILGAAGVSVFIILSGFLMTYNYYDREIKKNAFSFSVGKIKVLYPLHIIFMLIALIVPVLAMVSAKDVSSLGALIATVVCNILLLQPWVPSASVYFSLNGVSWYLGLCLFLYLIFPLVLKLMKKIRTKKAIVIGMITVFLLEAAVAVLAYCFASETITDFFSMHWLTYIFPVSRALDFIMGCFMGLIVVKYGRIVSKKNSLWCVLSFIAFAAVAVLCICGVPVFNLQWLNSSLLFLPVASLLIFTFSGEHIPAEKAICSKPILYLAGLTPYAFLIHQVLIDLNKYLLSGFFGSGGLTVGINIVVSMALTLLLSILYQKIVNRKRAKKA